MSATWSFILTDASGAALAELSTAAGRSVAFKRNSYAEVTWTMSHEDDSASLLFSALATTGVPRLLGYRRSAGGSSSVLRFRGPLLALSEVSEETSLLTATFRSPFGVLMGDGDKSGRFCQLPQSFLSTDAGLIALGLINVANTDSPSGLAADSSLIVATKVRDRTYPTGQNIGQAVQDLTAVLDGFDFFETFVAVGTSPTQVPTVGGPTGLNISHSPTDPWVGPNGQNWWVVTAVVGGVETTPSNEVTAIAFNGSLTFILNWLPVASATSYNIYRALATGHEVISPAFVASVSGGTLTFEDPGNPTTAGAAPSNNPNPVWFPEAYLNVVPALGASRPAARFEYGPRTLANVLSVDRTTTPPTNCILVTGGNGLSSTYSDTASVAKYGKWWGRADFSSVIEQTTLDDHAKGLCRPNPVKTLKFVPDLALSPLPFDDWGLGDTVPFLAARSALTENTQLRINGFTIPIDENGNETVSVDDPTSPEEDAITRASLIAEVVA